MPAVCGFDTDTDTVLKMAAARELSTLRVKTGVLALLQNSKTTVAEQPSDGLNGGEIVCNKPVIITIHDADCDAKSL